MSSHKLHLGTSMMFLFFCIGFIISLYNFFLPYGPISFTAGAELVIITTFSLAVLSLLLYFLRDKQTRWERFSLYALILGLLLGTLFAVWLLEAWVLLIVLFIALLGWFIQVLAK